jgi:hypothetical protein
MKLKEASLKVFPKLELFNGWGIYAQNFEGQILKNVMLEGVKEGIVCLPVHDAVAVPSDHIGWACDEMRYQWDKQMSVSGLARVTTDIPARVHEGTPQCLCRTHDGSSGAAVGEEAY